MLDWAILFDKEDDEFGKSLMLLPIFAGLACRIARLVGLNELYGLGTFNPPAEHIENT